MVEDDAAAPRRRRLLPIALTALIFAGAITVAVVVMQRSGTGEPTRDYTIPSSSMEKTFKVGDVVRVALAGYTLERGGIYVFHPNGTGGQALDGDHVATVTYIKRLIGLPGDWVQAIDGHVQICTGPAGQGCTTLNEPYVSSTQVTFSPIHVPAGRYFLLGDNREFSDDSRDWGSIRGSQFIGRYLEPVSQ